MATVMDVTQDTNSDNTADDVDREPFAVPCQEHLGSSSNHHKIIMIACVKSLCKD